MTYHSPYSILLVDHEPERLSLLQRLLETSLHLSVIRAASGTEALAHIANQTIDLLLVNIHLPDVSGFEVVRRMRKELHHSETPVCFLSTVPLYEEFRQPEFTSGIVDYFLLPLHETLFLNRMKAYIQLLEVARVNTQQLQTIDEAPTLNMPKTVHGTQRVMKEQDLLQTLLNTLPQYVYEQDVENQDVSDNGTEISSDAGHSPVAVQKAEAGLQRLVRLNELLLDTLPHPALLIRRDHIVLLANRIARDMGAVIGEPCRIWKEMDSETSTAEGMLPSSSQGKATLQGCLGRAQEVFSTQKPVNIPQVNRLGRIWDTWWIPIDEEIYLHYAIDITERKRHESELQRLNQQYQEASQHKSNFILNMSHELRTPLNAMIGYTSLTLNALRQKIPPEFVDNLSKAERSARHLLQLINDILDFSKIEAGKIEIFPEEIDVEDILEEVIITAEELFRHKDIAIEEEIDSDLPLIESDYTKLKQILDNLLNNAMKFTSVGSVTVRAREVDKGAAVRIEIEDTGEGISQDQLDSIFELFKQGDSSMKKKFAGTGLGLAISKSFCDMLHIELGVKSDMGKGTVFWLLIPAQISEEVSKTRIEDAFPRKSLKKEIKVSSGEIKKNFESILIIDDDIMNLNLHKTIFETAGYTVYTAKSGPEGLALIQQTPPEVILMDLAMPGMDGFEVTQQLQQHPETAKIPIIACSAFATRDSQQKAFDTGCVGYITKPVNPERLVAQVKKIIVNATEKK